MQSATEELRVPFGRGVVDKDKEGQDVTLKKERRENTAHRDDQTDGKSTSRVN